MGEWRFYAVDYKALKKTISSEGCVDRDEFNRILDESEKKLTKFYVDKECWAQDYLISLEDRVEKLRESHVESNKLNNSTRTSGASSTSSLSSTDSESDPAAGDKSSVQTGDSPKSPEELQSRELNKEKKYSEIKEAYRQVGKDPHFQNFIYAKKSLSTFNRELSLILEFLDLNTTAFSKILKKYDKVTGETTRENRMAEIRKRCPFLNGYVIAAMKEQVEHS